MMRASDIDPRFPRYLWRDRIPVGMITLLPEMPSGAKSLLTMHLAAAVSQRVGVLISAREIARNGRSAARCDPHGRSVRWLR